MTIIMSNEELIKNYVDERMMNYFAYKMSGEEKEIVKIKVIEVLKYLILAGHTNGPIPFTAELDDVWHLWILQTKQYAELMTKLPHGIYIHHSANEYMNPIENKEIRDKERADLMNEKNEIERQVSYLVSYIYNFGNFTDITYNYYAYAKKIMKTNNLDVDGLNDHLKDLAA